MTLAELQNKLKHKKYDAFLVSRNNIFIDQDIREDENLLMQLTGFSGSAGSLLITPQKNFLFVDGRYELQAPQQVNPKETEVVCTTKISLMQWLSQNFSGKKIGYNPWCWSIKDILKFNDVDMIGDADFLPFILTDKKAKLFEHDLSYCGIDREHKLSSLADKIENKNLQAYFISSADSVSWLMNLRSTALPDTPVFRAFALVDTKRHIWIFTDNVDTTDIKSPITFLPLSALAERLKKFKNQKIGTDFNTTAAALFELAQSYKITLVDMPDSCQQEKSVKNDCELEGIRKAHIRDGVAVCKFLYWLDNNWQGKTELDLVKKLHDFRAKEKNYVSESFETIAAFGSNGAIVHYSPTPQTNKPIKSNNLLLLDSGAQYYDGTTDITRTVVIGTPMPEMCENYTLVLKAHIALSSTLFPEKTTGARLDALAREVMWKEGKNYNHGTGHGVGCFLNVHEGPQYISASCNQPLQARQISSIEPGYYLENKYGIRIENLVEICPSQRQGFLKFKNLTLVPIDSRAINKYLLDEEEISWLNTYHREVFEKIAPYLNAQEKEWLEQACAPL